jgi:hypothetical protein
MSGEDSILDQFSNPERKLKRKKEQERREHLKRMKNVSQKENLTDVFNDPLTESEFHRLTPFVKNEKSYKQLEYLVKNSSIKDVGFVSEPREGLLNFMKCCYHCDDWLSKKLKEIGWVENQTNYKFESLCNGVSEVVHETLVCFQMACKQMMRFQEYKTQILSL